MSDSTRKVLSLKREGAEAARSARIEERLHKVLAQAGLGSRRALEERIARGEVQINGKVATLGDQVAGGDRVDLDGKTFVVTTQTDPGRVLVYNKPEGEVTTREDPEGRPTVFEAMPPLKGARWVSVGRLDINTTGLLLLTTDGELANALMHPSSEVQREYVCRIHGDVDEAVVQRLARGVELEDGPARFDEIERIGGSDSHDWFRVVLDEGRNREVRRLWESQGFQVSRLKRVRYGDIALPRLLKRGQCEELSSEQVLALREKLGLAPLAPVLSLQPVIGQRRARAKAPEMVRPEGGAKAWVNGSYADEGAEARAFDRLREDPGGRRGAGRRKPGVGAPGKRGGKPFAGKPGGKPGGKPAGARGGGKQRGDAQPPAPRAGANPTEFRSWYVPDASNAVALTSHTLAKRGAGKAAAGKPKPGGKPFTKPTGKPAGTPRSGPPAQGRGGRGGGGGRGAGGAGGGGGGAGGGGGRPRRGG
jgi:23S rRNA pseudouridine2605 synthase